MQKNFMTAEKAVLLCQQNISNLAALPPSTCFIESTGKNVWRITSKEKPSIEIHVSIDEKSGLVSRLNWRQVLE